MHILELFFIETWLPPERNCWPQAHQTSWDQLVDGIDSWNITLLSHHQSVQRNESWSGTLLPISLLLPLITLPWKTGVWVNSSSWWWTGRPGVLWFVGSQRVGNDWATELNWTELMTSHHWKNFPFHYTNEFLYGLKHLTQKEIE